MQVWRTGESRLEVAAGRYPHPTATADLALYRDTSFGEVHGVAHDQTFGLFVAAGLSGVLRLLCSDGQRVLLLRA